MRLAQETLRRMGLSDNQLIGLSPDQQLAAIADGSAAIQHPALRTALAMDDEGAVSVIEEWRRFNRGQDVGIHERHKQRVISFFVDSLIWQSTGNTGSVRPESLVPKIWRHLLLSLVGQLY